VHALTDAQVYAEQKALLERPGRDGFVRFRLAARGEGRALEPGPPLAAVAFAGTRFVRVAPGLSESRLALDAPEAGAIVFPVPYHPRLEGTVDGAPVRPVPVLPGFAALPVAAGRHELVLAYRTDRVKDALLVLALAALAAGPW